MTTRLQTQRFAVTNTRPATSSRPQGEVWMNFPDLRLGMIDPTQTAIDIVPVRSYAATATYAAGDYVVYSGQLQRAKTALSPKAYAATDWDPILAQSTIVAGYLPLSGGTLTGPLTLAADPTQPAQAATKRYSDLKLPLAGGTMSGGLIISTPSADSSIVLNHNAAANSVITGLTGGSTRWQFILGNSDAEGPSGSNAGSNVAINRYSDSGAYLSTPLKINRATGIVDFAVQPTVNGAAMAFLPIAGGTVTGPLTLNGAVTVNNTVTTTGVVTAPSAALSGQLYVGGSAYIIGSLFLQSYDNWEWNFGTDASGNHYQTFRSGWYDLWRTTDGMRIWAGPGGALMDLDGSGNLNVQTSINTGTVNANTLTSNNLTVSGSALNANNATVYCVNVSASNQVYATNTLSTGGTVGGATLSISGNATISGTAIVGNLTVNNALNVGGQITCNAITDNGPLNMGSDITMNGHWINGLGQINPSGNLGISNNVDMQGHYIINCPGVSPSDIRLKSNVGASTLNGLELIRRIKLHQFDMFARHYDIGFIANDLPEALTGIAEDYYFVDTNSMLAALVSAVQELDKR